MEEILKEEKNKSHKEFSRLLAEDLKSRKFVEGSIVSMTVEEVGKKFIYLDSNLKSTCAIPIHEFEIQQEKVVVGAKVEVYLEKIEDKWGQVVASFEKAKRHKSWKKLEKAFETGEEVTGTILSKVKGGFACSIDSCLTFLPGSQLDLRPLKNTESLIKTPQKFMVVKIDKRRGNIVVSRRAIMEKARDKDRSELIAKLKEGDVVEGTVKSIVDWGVFVDLNGVDSLMHITSISYSRIDKPSQLLSLNQKIKVKIIKIENNKIHVSMKDLYENPWDKKIDKYEIGKKYPAVVTKVQDYGVFAMLEEGLEGLIHTSQLHYVKKAVHPGKILSTSQKIEVILLEKDPIKKRLSLSYKLISENPYKKFAKENPVGSKVSGKIKSITDFGLFATVKDTELDLLIHKNDLSYNQKDCDLSKYKKGQEIFFQLLECNLETEKIRGGLKQLTADDFNVFFADKKLGDIITVTVSKTAKNGIYVKVGNKNLSFFIKQSELAKDANNCRVSRFTLGDKIDCMVTKIQKDDRVAFLSIKSLEEKQSKEAIKKWSSESSGGQIAEILGPLLKNKKKK